MTALAPDPTDPFVPKRRRRSRRAAAKRNRRTLVRLLAILSSVPVVAAVTIWVTEPVPTWRAIESPTIASDQQPYGSSDPTAAPAVVYRYSVVPGGVDSVEAVLSAVEGDAVVAAHYADLDVDRLAAQRLAEPMTAHVSYRIGDTIFWTAQTVTLNAGERVLSDGTHLVRARCGNRIEMAPLLPAFSAEPDPDEFDSLVAAALLPRENDPALGPVVGAQLRASGDPIPAPEPGTIVLLGAGLAAGLAKRRRRRSGQAP